MSEAIEKKLVPKTFEERRLNAIYMNFIRSDKYIPEIVVRSFLADVEKMRKENLVYTNN